MWAVCRLLDGTSACTDAVITAEGFSDVSSQIAIEPEERISNTVDVRDVTSPAKEGHRRLWGRTLAGLVVGLVACECLTRLFSSPLDAVPAKHYKEGLSRVTIGEDHLRATGNPWLTGGDVGLILGDSHVAAVEVDDLETMGSVLERNARGSGLPLNVVQYGWPGEGVAAYVGLAPELLAAWHPRWTAIMMNEGDLGANALGGDSFQMTVGADGDVQVSDQREGKSNSSFRRMVRSVFQRSALVTTGFVRVKEIMAGSRRPPEAAPPPAAATEVVNVPRPALRALRQVYGDRLVIVFLPIVGVNTPAQPHPKEVALMQVCQAEALTCVSLRPAMIEQRDGQAGIARGFPNTLPGVGHLNGSGHRLVADAIQREVTRWTAAGQ